MDEIRKTLVKSQISTHALLHLRVSSKTNYLFRLVIESHFASIQHHVG